MKSYHVIMKAIILTIMKIYFSVHIFRAFYKQNHPHFGWILCTLSPDLYLSIGQSLVDIDSSLFLWKFWWKNTPRWMGWALVQTEIFTPDQCQSSQLVMEWWAITTLAPKVIFLLSMMDAWPLPHNHGGHEGNSLSAI